MFKLTPFEKEVLSNENKNKNLDNFLNNFFEPFNASIDSKKFSIDLEETGDGYKLTADMPGIKKEDLKITYSDDVLCIKVNAQENKEEKEKNYIHRERYYKSMKRSIEIPDIDKSTIKAKLDDGILTLEAKKDTRKNEAHTIDVE